MAKTIKDIASAWKQDKRPYVKQSTLAAYSLCVENHIVPAFGNATNVSEEEVQNFVLAKLNTGLSQKTIKDILMVLKMIVRFGEKNKWLQHVDWDIKFPGEQKPKTIEVLSIANQKKIMRYVVDNFTFRNFGIYLCLCTGLRIGEVCALTWADIDTDNKTVNVNKTIERIYKLDGGKRHTELLVDQPKTSNSVRQVPMSRELLKMVLPLKKVVNNSYYVLTNSDKPTEPRTYRTYYKQLMIRLGIPYLKFHGLRHTFATRCIESKCDYKTVSVLLGHANISTTLNLYVHPNMEQKKRCIDRMFKALK
jgi:integrase